MSKPIIVANWKMNPNSQEDAKNLFDDIKKGVEGIKNVDIIICPPFTQYSVLSTQYSVANIQFGAQDVFWQDKGTYTGEISPLMLRDLGCEYVIVGHSERRKFLGETDEMVNKKIKACLKNELIPILCVGENFDQREKDKTEDILEQQLNNALEGISDDQIKNIIITYEPVWAISGGTEETRHAATPNDAVYAAKFIREILGQLYNKNIAENVRILYGGSVDSKNAEDFMKQSRLAAKQKGIDGALVGGASLNAEEFVVIVNKTEELRIKIED